ncbi:MAG: hypothetical protein EOM90_11055 [Alphaproteobacteria bacterium]|nr:hypothetical protein [Alphaproteobacteria bacterium]
MLQPELLNNLFAVLNENQIDYMVTGSIVSSLQGEPRATHDVDIVVNIRTLAIPAMIAAFPPPQYYLDPHSMEDAIRHRSMFNLLDTNEGDKIDFWILTDEPFDLSRFERKYEENVFGFKMKISKPEDTILAKLHWAKLSGGSEKQFTDALRVYEVQYGNLDLNYLLYWVNHLQVSELWNKLTEEANPIE